LPGRRLASVAVGWRPFKHSPALLALQEVHLLVSEGWVGKAAAVQEEAINVMEGRVAY